MTDLAVTDDVTDATSQLVRNLAGETALSPAIRSYSMTQTGSFTVSSAITGSQELRRRLIDEVRDRIAALATSVDAAASALAAADSGLTEDLP
jgi:hypothetical protein